MRKTEMARKGVQPSGENGELWKAKINMLRMFKENKLLCGAVPPTSTATPTSRKQRNLLGGAVPPTSTATPIVRKHEELFGGAVPPTTMATPQGQTQKKLLGRAVRQLKEADEVIVASCTASINGYTNRR